MRLREIGWGGMDWTDLAQDRDMGVLKQVHTLSPIFLMSSSLIEAQHTSYSGVLGLNEGVSKM
jgi:hypothetical protein